jgi:quercetin dioxygenase-like cupin family protein
LRVPDGGKFGAHYHAYTERVTVISGTMLVGVGDKMNVATMTELPAGSFISIPGGLHHYAMAKGETVIQIGGNGPMSMTPVKASK